MKRGATLAEERIVDINRSAVTFTELIGLPTVGYEDETTVAAPGVSQPTTESKPLFHDVATFVFPSFCGISRGGDVQIVNGKACREVLNFDGTTTGVVAVVQSDALVSAALDKPYCDRVADIAIRWSQQVKAGVVPAIGVGEQQTITQSIAETVKKRGRRSNAEIAAANAAEAAPGVPPATTVGNTGAVATVRVVATSPTEAALEVQRAFWTSIKATAEAELAKIIPL